MAEIIDLNEIDQIIESAAFCDDPELSLSERLELIQAALSAKAILSEETEYSFGQLLSEETSPKSSEQSMLMEMNIRRLDPKTQVRLRTLMIAISMAKQNKDPYYDKYKRGVNLRKHYKELILRKYGPKAYNIALAERGKKKQ